MKRRDVVYNEETGWRFQSEEKNTAGVNRPADVAQLENSSPLNLRLTLPRWKAGRISWAMNRLMDDALQR